MRTWNVLDPHEADHYRIPKKVVSNQDAVCYSLEGPNNTGVYQYTQLLIIQKDPDHKWIKIDPRSLDDELLDAMYDFGSFFLSDDDQGGNAYLNKYETIRTIELLKEHAKTMVDVLEHRAETFQGYTLSQLGDLGIDTQLYPQGLRKDIVGYYLQTVYPSETSSLTLIEIGDVEHIGIGLYIQFIDVPSQKTPEQSQELLHLTDNTSGSIWLDKQGLEHFCDLLTEQLKRFEVNDNE